MSGIEAITISGYKSLASEQSIEIRHLLWRSTRTHMDFG